MSKKTQNLIAIALAALVGFAVINLFAGSPKAAEAAVLPIP